MSPQAQALASVERTKTWQEWSDPASLGASPDQRRYMNHRLQAAFLLGFEKGVESSANRLRDFAMGMRID